MSKPKDAPERTFSQADVDKIVSDRLTRDRQTRVLNEERTYSARSPHSYFGDLSVIATDPQGLLHPDAHARLTQHAKEQAHEMEARSAEGRYVHAALIERFRTDDEDVHRRQALGAVREFRALATGGGTTATATGGASAFVAPYFLLVEWALFRGANRTFADCCHNLPLPEWGIQVNVPTFVTAPAAGQQAEGSGVPAADPTAQLQSSSVVTLSGQINLTQQFNDRAFFGGGVADTLIYLQLQQQLEEKVDVFAINTAITAGGTIAASATFGTSIANFYQDLARGRENLTDTAGTRLKPTHLFTTSDLYSYVTRQVNSSGIPLLPMVYQNGFTPPATMQNDPSSRDAMKNFTGTVLPGGVLWFTDDNIPPTGANTQLIVSAPEDAVLLLESPQPTLGVFPQTYAGNLVVAANLRKYVAVITKHAGGTVALAGNAYPTSAL